MAETQPLVSVSATHATAADGSDVEERGVVPDILLARGDEES